MEGKFVLRRTVALMLGLLLAVTSQAVEPPDLYTAEVAFDTQRRDGRARAYKRALQLVLNRMTTEPMLAIAELQSPGQYVLGWRESPSDRLWVSFDGIAISAELQAAGIPVWGSDRPLTLVWLGVQRADGEREILSATDRSDENAEPKGSLNPLRQSLREAASLSGLPISLPVMDDIDAAAVSVSDVWGGFDNVLRPASRRYRADSVLVGRVALDSVGSARWQWWFGGESLTLRGEPRVVLQRVADDMLAQFAGRPGESLQVRIRVSGLRSGGDYAQLLAYLESRSLIDNLRVDGMQQDEITVVVDALASRQRLQRVLGGELLESLNAAGPGDLPLADDVADLYFRWRGAGTR